MPSRTLPQLFDDDQAPPTDDLPPDRRADVEAVYDALCFLQGPATLASLSSLLVAAGLRTARGTTFSPLEVRKLLDWLAQAGRVTGGSSEPWRLATDAGWPRFRELVGNEASRRTWWQAWLQLHRHDSSYVYLNKSRAELVGVLRTSVYGGGTLHDFMRLRSLTNDRCLEREVRVAALLRPFEPEMLQRVEPDLRWMLVTVLLFDASGNTDADELLVLRWLHGQATTPGTSAGIPEHLFHIVAEWLVFCGRNQEARDLLAPRRSPQAQALRAMADIAEGRYAEGIATFEPAWKALATEMGKRKDVLPASVSWVYVMALLQSADRTAWTRARKFAATESGKREANPFTMWGAWQAAIDQRLGDAARNAAGFALEGEDGGLEGRRHALEQLQRLLLACWVGAEPKVGKATEVQRRQAALLAQRLEAQGLSWLAALARRAAAMLLGATLDDRDAAVPFFVSEAQDRWRDALSSILALGEATASVEPGAAGKEAERLIWAVTTNGQGRIESIAPLRQKVGPRGLGKPKAVALSTLVKSGGLSIQDAAIVRMAKRDAWSGAVVLDAQAAPALVRHPFVAWADEPTRFVEIVESMPALEVMTRGVHVGFKVLDPIQTTPLLDTSQIHPAYLSDSLRRLVEARNRQQVRQQVLLLRDGDERARLVRVTPAQLRVAELVAQGWQVPVDAKAELDAALRVLATHFQIASDAEAGTEVPGSSVLRGEMVAQGSGLTLRVVAAPFGDFGPRLAPGSGRERATAVHQGVTLFTRRDLAAERDNLRSLTREVDFIDDDGNHEWDVDDPEQALAVVEALARLKGAIVSEWPKGKPLRVLVAASPSVKLNIASERGEWFDVDGEIELDDGEVLQLRRLLDVMDQSRGRFVALGDGGFLALSDALRRQLADLKALAQPHARGQRLSAAAAAAWAGQVEADASRAITLRGDAAWRKRVDAWAHAQSQTFEPPRTLQAELRDYQREGYVWLARLAASGFGGCLADDMGLGKTLQTLALLIDRAAGGAALVVAPTSVCGNWMAEAARFAPGLDVQLYGSGDGDAEGGDDGSAGDGPDAAAGDDTTDNTTDDITDDATDDESDDADDASSSSSRRGSDKRRADTARLKARRRMVQGLGAGQVLVCSYAMLQLDANIVGTREWHTAVLDEAQAIKNAATSRARVAASLRADFKLALTGTPIENRLGELWSIMAFANPGLLGSAERFGQRFAAPIERGGDPQASKRLRRLIAPFLLRRTKTEVLTDLPPRTEIVHEVVPAPRERALLEALRQQAEASVGRVIADGASKGQAQIHVLAALTKLRRAACDPRLVAPELGLIGAKVQEFERLAQELVAGRHKALVFSQFTDFLALLRERLDGSGLTYQYLDGSTAAAERGKRVAAFQGGEGEFFLISLKAGGFGLNLTAADYVIITDPWWNPAAEDQASGRAHRIGQQRPVTVYRLVTRGSIEDRIVKLHHRKRDLADGILSGQDGAGAALGADELMALLRGDGADASATAGAGAGAGGTVGRGAGRGSTRGGASPKAPATTKRLSSPRASPRRR